VKNFSKCFPGFRSGVKSKKIIASIYYAMTVLILFKIGIGTFLIVLIIPFMLFFFISIIRKEYKRDLVDLVKKNLNNGRSFKHVSTVYTDKHNYLIIKMTYKAKNTYGRMILRNVTAKTDYKTNMITIIAENN